MEHEPITKGHVLDRALRGEGCLGRSTDAEPVFVLCGRDPVAGDIIREWADRREVRAVRLGLLDADEKAKIADARNASLIFDTFLKARTAGQSER